MRAKPDHHYAVAVEPWSSAALIEDRLDEKDRHGRTTSSLRPVANGFEVASCREAQAADTAMHSPSATERR
jgi:hypothetical protein